MHARWLVLLRNWCAGVESEGGVLEKGTRRVIWTTYNKLFDDLCGAHVLRAFKGKHAIFSL